MPSLAEAEDSFALGMSMGGDGGDGLDDFLFEVAKRPSPVMKGVVAVAALVAAAARVAVAATVGAATRDSAASCGAVRGSWQRSHGPNGVDSPSVT